MNYSHYPSDGHHGDKFELQELKALSVITLMILKVSPKDGPLHYL